MVETLLTIVVAMALVMWALWDASQQMHRRMEMMMQDLHDVRTKTTEQGQEIRDLTHQVLELTMDSYR